VWILPIVLANPFSLSALQKIINDDSHKLAQSSPLSIRNSLKLSFGFSADPHTYGIGTILHWVRLQWPILPATYTLG